MDKGFIVNILGRHVHQGEVERAFRRPDIFVGDGSAVAKNIVEEGLPGPAEFLFPFGGAHSLEILQGEFRIHGDDPPRQPDGRIHFLAAAKGILDFVVGGGKDVPEEILQKLLAKATTHLGGPENVLETAQVLSHLRKVPDFFVQLPGPSSSAGLFPTGRTVPSAQAWTRSVRAFVPVWSWVPVSCVRWCRVSWTVLMSSVTCCWS